MAKVSNYATMNKILYNSQGST